MGTLAQSLSGKKNIIFAHKPEARAKARSSLLANAQSEEWRRKVSEATKRAMHRPEVRRKHLLGLRRAFAKGINFRGGNGQEPTGAMRQAGVVLTPLGFIQEHVIPTRGHATGLKPPANYKVDFANPKTKTAIEFDGPCHANFKKREFDVRKTTVLLALGWNVIRIKHRHAENLI